MLKDFELFMTLMDCTWAINNDYTWSYIRDFNTIIGTKKGIQSLHLQHNSIIGLLSGWNIKKIRDKLGYHVDVIPATNCLAGLYVVKIPI